MSTNFLYYDKDFLKCLPKCLPNINLNPFPKRKSAQNPLFSDAFLYWASGIRTHECRSQSVVLQFPAPVISFHKIPAKPYKFYTFDSSLVNSDVVPFHTIFVCFRQFQKTNVYQMSTKILSCTFYFVFSQKVFYPKLCPCLFSKNHSSGSLIPIPHFPLQV